MVDPNPAKQATNWFEEPKNQIDAHLVQTPERLGINTKQHSVGMSLILPAPIHETACLRQCIHNIYMIPHKLTQTGPTTRALDNRFCQEQRNSLSLCLQRNGGANCTLLVTRVCSICTEEGVRK